MDVAGPFPHRRGNDDVDQIDDGRLIRHHFDVVQVLALGRGTFLGTEILDHLLDGHLIALGNLFEDFGSGRVGFLHLQTAEQPNVIDDPLVSGFRGRDVKRSILDLER
jgi:hypothetical protein